MKCPGCGESNEAGMQFCINCGHPLSAPAAVTTSSASNPVAQAPPVEELPAASGQTGPQAMVLVCTVCNKTDPLNGQFCVYCGGRTVAGPAPAPAAAYNLSPSMSASQGGAVVSADSPRLSEEIVRSVHAPPAPQSSGLGALSIFLSVILGAGLGFGAVFALKEDIQKTALKKYWPAEGLLVYSLPPDADLRINDVRHKSVMLGRTSSAGTIHLPTISPGNYSLKLADGKGKEASTDFSCNSGEQTIIGYPDRLQLK